MWFMSMRIDVVFVRRVSAAPGAKGSSLSATHVVCSAYEDIRPWKPLPLRDGRAGETIELPVGTIARCGIAAGDELCIS
jgi:uncharacterized membrane protein (UPF0127 family)